MTQLPKVDALDLQLEGGWLTIWFNQPDKRNALTEQLSEQLTQVLESVRGDRAVRGITLRGRGGVFCAGGDLKSFTSDFQSGPREDVIAMSMGIANLLHLVNTMPQVVVVLIEGAAMAGGLGITCCADVVICESGARFALTETMIGLSPAQIAPYVIARLGYATARRLMLTAARFKGEDALELGLADFVHENVEGLELIEVQIRKQVLSCSPQAVADTKALILALPGLTDQQQRVQAAAENFAERLLSDDAREGIGAFFDKRKPRWAEQ